MKIFAPAFLSICFLALGLLACDSADMSTPGATSSGGSSGSTPAERRANAVALCEAYAAPTVVCGSHPIDCEAKPSDCLAGMFRAEAFAPLEACLRSRTCTADDNRNCSCTGSDDECFAEVGKTMPASDARDAYVAACRQKLAECGRASESFTDDWCTTGGFGFELFSDALYDALRPCFGKTCGERTIATCLDEAHVAVAGESCRD